MFAASDAAVETLASYLRDQGINNPAVRITPMAGNCAGPHLRLRVGEAKDNDRVFERGGITFVVEQTLLAECGSITVDFAESESPCGCSGGCAGFRISGEKTYRFTGRCSQEQRCGGLRHPAASVF
jgi:Fe-S cluster assembly iron-binding protein IscA